MTGLPAVSVTLPEAFTVLSAVGLQVDGPEPVPGPFDALGEIAASFEALDIGLSAVGVHALPAGGLGHTWLTLACVPLDTTDAARTADGLALGLRAEHVDVHRVRLPAGEAVSVSSFGRREAPGAEDGVVAQLEVGVLQVHLPMEGVDRVLVLTVESTALEAWVDVCATAAEVAKSLDWERSD